MNDSGIEKAKAYVGSAMPSFEVDVERGAIRKFAYAIGDLNPIYLDVDFAKEAGYRDVVAPPTYPASFRPAERQPWLEVLDGGRILAGGESFTYARPIVAGESLMCEMRLADIIQKNGSQGILFLIEQEVAVRDGNGEFVCRNGRTVIYRPAGELSYKD